MDEPTVFFLFAGQDIILPRRDSVPEAERPGGPRGARPGPGHAAAACADLMRGAVAAPRRDYPWQEAACSALALDEAAAAAVLAGGAERVPLRQAIGLYDPESMKPALKGLALLNWLEGARRCGACGEPLEDAPPDGDDMGGRRCPACGRFHFPKISPAVIVLVRKDGKALLAHNARFPAGRFGLIAGFVDPGETLEEAAVREAREEAGIEIGNLRYLRSQPWPFPDSLMLAFTADWISGEARPDGREISELRWCAPGEMPAIPPPGSIARYLIDRFVAGAMD